MLSYFPKVHFFSGPKYTNFCGLQIVKLQNEGTPSTDLSYPACFSKKLLWHMLTLLDYQQFLGISPINPHTVYDE